VLLYIANHSLQADYAIRTSTLEQSTSAPSVENPTGATTDPTGTTNKLEKAMDQLNAKMDRISTFLRQLCQVIPIGECSREARKNNSHESPGTGCKNDARKRQRSESLSSEEGRDSPRVKFRKDSDAIRVTASEDKVQNLLDGLNAGSTHKNLTDEGIEDNDEILKELTATFRDENTKGPPISKQLAETANIWLGKKLEQDNLSSLLGKYDPTENCSDITVTRVNPEICQSLNSFREKADLGSPIWSRPSRWQHLQPSQTRTNCFELLIYATLPKRICLRAASILWPC